MWGRCVCWCLLLFTWPALSAGTRLYPCGDAGYQDVEENTPLTFYCDQYTSGLVSWKYKSPLSSTFGALSTCSSTECTPTKSPVWTTTYISASNSSLRTTFTNRTRAQSGGLYRCENEECGLHVIVPAVVSQPPPPVINRQDSGYTLSASVNVTRVYSSRGNYSCLWQLGPSRQTTPPDLSPPAADTNNTADRTGRCDVTMSLPNTSGTYPCSVTVTPGNTQASCGNIIITRPSPPTVSCSPSDFIAENTSLTCTCSTANIGQPGGRLRWFTGTGSDISTEVISGAYNVSTLDMKWTVRRDDHNNRKFRCINNWMVNITAQSDYTARVAYGPDTVSIQGNSTFYTDTTGSQRMTLTCQAGGVNPSSSLTYNWDILCDDRQQSTCTFRPRPGPSGDDNKVITCTVTNTKNNNKRQQPSVTLDIKYPPLSAPHISGYVNGQVLYEGDSLNLTCAVTGGDPVVTSVTLTCPDRHVQNPITGQSSSLVISRLSRSDHNLTCVCRGQWVTESYYTLTDSRTLTVYFPVRSVQLTLNSLTSLLEVNESQSTDVTFQCTADFARPSPHLVLSDDQGREVARLASGSDDIPGQPSVLTHTIRGVRCENSAVYTCTAENGVGRAVNSTATLRVLCDIRILKDSFSSQDDGVPVLDASREAGELHFQILTTKTPHKTSFLFLGPDLTGDGYPPTSGLLRVTCQQTSVAYKSRCILTASNVTQDWIGYYNVTIATARQAVSFTFQIKRSSVDKDLTHCSDRWAEGFGTGLGVGLATLLVVLIVLLLCLWRRQWRLPCTEKLPTESRDDEIDVHGQSLQETEFSADAVTDTGHYEHLKHDDIGLRSEYSMVSHPTPATTHHSPETDEGYEIPRHRPVPAEITER